MNLTTLSLPYFRRIFAAEQHAGDDIRASQTATLHTLLRQGARTDYGRTCGLRPGMSYEEFVATVPQGDYPRLRPWVMRMVSGEADVLWPGRCRRFAQSSGTSDGKSKYIPVTDRSLQRCHYAGAAYSLASYLHYYPDSRVFGGKNFILGGSYATELETPRGVCVGDLSATLIDRINPLVNLFRIPSKRIALMADWTEKLPALIEASRRADVRSISGVPSWFLTVIKGVIARQGAGNIRQVWPNLEVFFHGGIAFGPYREQYERLAPGCRFWENYNASEGFFGVQARPLEGSATTGKTPQPPMRLLLNADTFYEFIPADGGDPVPAWEVEEGKVYALLITSSNGLWRYPLGDTVLIRSRNPLEITIAGRTKHFINAFGEEVMVHNTDAALAHACAATGAEVENYTAGPVYASDRSRGRHQWLIEFAKQPADLEAFADILDKALQAENSDYQAKRAGGIFLDRLTITPVPAGTFDRWLASTGRLGGQRKVPRLSNDRHILDPLLSTL